MGKEEIKSAIDSFEEDNYVEAKETLKKVIQAQRDDYLKNSLELSKEEEDKEE